MSHHNNNTKYGTLIFMMAAMYLSATGNGKVARAGYNDIGAVSSWEIQSTDYLRNQKYQPVLIQVSGKRSAKEVWLDDCGAYISVGILYLEKYEGGNPQAFVMDLIRRYSET